MASKHITTKILAWFRQHRRDLPWRHNASPWQVLASEIMLQQTQVDRVIPKYREFIQRWPTPSALATTPTQEMLRFWSGLGYNRRALHLQKLAGILATKYGDEVPQDIEVLRTLPGIGRYTASAVASFAFNQDVTLWDTNVRRIMLRVAYGGEFAKNIPSDTVLEKILAETLPKGRSAEWHSALMDFGAAVCRSRNPACATCPLLSKCIASRYFLCGEEPTQKLVRPQPAFQGSLRALRGEILRHVTVAPHGIPMQMLQKRLTDARTPQALDALKKEGFLKVVRGTVRCA